MEMLILKALDPDAENRFASADEMLGQLMEIGGNDTDIIRDCPHCGHKSSVTRQFCPNCKQYISKKAHALKQNGSGAIVTDAAGMHQVKASGPTARLEPGNKAATATNLALPTGKTEFDLVSVKPYVIGVLTAAVVAIAGLGVWKAFHDTTGALVSRGEAVFVAGDDAKAQGARAYAAGDYTRAASAFQKASEEDPTDGEARIYWQNAVLMIGKADLVTVAVAGPFTGKFEAKGRAELQGAAHAQQELNARGKAPRVLLELADDGSSHERALEASKKIVETKGVIGVIGHLDSRSTRAALPIYGLAGLPVISPTSTSIELSDSSPNFFRLSPDDGLQGRVLAEYVAGDLKAKRVSVVLPEDNPYIQGLATSFTKEIEERDVRAEQAIFGENPDWAALAKGLAGQKPDAIFLAGSHLDAIALAKAARAAGIQAPIIGGDSLYLPELARQGGPAVEGMVCATYYHGALTSPAAKDFELEFRSKFQAEANSRAALTYEALNLMVQAIDVVGPQREAVASYIKKLGEQGYTTLSGNAKIDAKGNVRRPVFLMKVRDGRFVPVRQVRL
jgi:branched-chain amino acid transport system substrate-binding protein